MKGKVIFVFWLAVFIQVSTNAQEDFTRQYTNAKALFKEGKYNLAMETFKALIPVSQKNQYSEYATFYYALSAYNLGYKALAKTSLNQIKTLYPAWEKLNEVNFWIGKINLEDKDYFQGMKILDGIKDVSLQPVIESTKTKAISGITDPETLRMLHGNYPNDRIVAKALAILLSKNLTVSEDRILLDSLINKFKFNRPDFIPTAPKTYYRDMYSVSVLLPFMANTLDPSPAPKRNQAVLDLYEGMKLAVDTLKTQGVKISLRAYDTERSVDKIRNILKADELKNTDLIVGPYFQEESKPIIEFSLANKINVFNPLNNNSEIMGINPFSFLYQPSLEVLGKKSGEFLAGYTTRKSCMVFYGTSRRDSIVAANFMQAANENGLRIVSSHRLSKEGSKMILSTLATPTEYDEYHYPKQFTLKKDSLGSIFVASDDALIYAKVISSVETRKDNIIVLGSESWLDQSTVDLEKFHALPVVLFAPNFSAPDRAANIAFVKKFIRKHGRTPSGFASLGYELMLFAGNQLKKNGVYFQEGLIKSGTLPGYLSEGFNYQNGRSNELIPFVKFDQGKIKVVDKR